MGLVPERPRVDHPVDRPELYGVRALQVTGTNGRLLDHFYRSSSSKDGSIKVATKRLFDDREPRSFACEIQLRCAETPIGVFVGGFTRRVTPVPIPNTVVKPAGPMILLQRESRSLPALN